jgi:hypothetical protein
MQNFLLLPLHLIFYFLDVTTSSNPASPTTNNSGQICYCPCDGGYTDLTTAELADKIEKMVTELKIDLLCRTFSFCLFI